MKDNSLQTIELEMAILIRRIATIASNRQRDKQQRNLDRAAYLLLHQISEDGTAGVKALATELQLDVSTVSRQAAALEKKEYVVKIPSSVDRRSYNYEVTEKGQEELTAYRTLRLERLTTLLEEWPEKDCEQFGHLLKKFNQELREFL
ncbi:MarR family winged helix-turn-helix transcriptional regulator [Sediminibacillus massiliensis]|uniref:MarR family winged helix-turn-helix transcriptional regulator n=1 Tax=Sediminibacillus massiliensis TaxID=1926277 RepID=UPI00098836CF|nr:MarR family transcriptional regulator [Sediminibacillus massiliensis]